MWCGGPGPNFGPSSAFSSSLRFKQAAFGFRFRSEINMYTWVLFNRFFVVFLQNDSQKLTTKGHLPLTCCSSVIITSTAILSMPSLVCGLSVFKCDIHILPNSFKASFMSRIRILKSTRYVIKKWSITDFKM